jgi:hypothetical protein
MFLPLRHTHADCAQHYATSIQQIGQTKFVQPKSNAAGAQRRLFPASVARMSGAISGVLISPEVGFPACRYAHAGYMRF